MLPSMAYDWVSVVPAGGSTTKAATAMKEAASSGRTGGRAPRATASRPAPTPAAATTAAPHRVNSTKASGSRSDSHHGGPPAACAIAGTLIDGPATDIAIIARSETVMQAAAVQTSPRVCPVARQFRSLTVFTPQMGLSMCHRGVGAPQASRGHLRRTGSHRPDVETRPFTPVSEPGPVDSFAAGAGAGGGAAVPAAPGSAPAASS